MTTNVKIGTDYVHPGKRLRIRVVDPVTGEVLRELAISDHELLARAGHYQFDTLYVHEGSRLVIEEVGPT